MNHIIQIGKDLPLIKDEYKTEEHPDQRLSVAGMVTCHIDGKPSLLPTAMPGSPKGLVIGGKGIVWTYTQREIVDTEIYFIDDIGFTQPSFHLPF